jgi:hypothetical protein
VEESQGKAEFCDVARSNGEKRLSQSLEAAVDKATMEKSGASWTGLDSVSMVSAVGRGFRRVVAARASRLSNRPRSFSPVRKESISIFQVVLLFILLDLFFFFSLIARRFSFAEMD